MTIEQNTPITSYQIMNFYFMIGRPKLYLVSAFIYINTLIKDIVVAIIMPSCDLVCVHDFSIEWRRDSVYCAHMSSTPSEMGRSLTLNTGTPPAERTSLVL